MICRRIFPPMVQEAVPVVLDYNDLMNENSDLTESVERAFGSEQECLGICLVKNVPSLVQLRENLLRLASKLANLDEKLLKKMESPDSNYSFGWSHGKEIMNGRPDVAKGSFYNNPILNNPAKDDQEYRKKYPAYGGPNVWPNESLPELESAFMALGSLIVEVGKLVARHCDKFLVKKYKDIPSNFLYNMINVSQTHKARLLHYFHISEQEADGSNMDSWCGIHVDHSVLTGLTSAMYFDESNPEFPEIFKTNPKADAALKDAGLYIKNRDGSFTQAKIPSDCLAFQIGEAAQIASRGLLVATPHLVRGASYPNMSRNTFAVFMQPNTDEILKPGYDFAAFTKDVVSRHY